MNKDLITKYDRQLFNWCLKKCHNYLDAEDLKQDIYLQIIKAQAKDIIMQNEEHFIWKVAYYTWCKKAKEYLKRKREITITEEIENILKNEIDILKLVEADEIKNLLADNVNNFKEPMKTIVKLYYYQNLSIKEIASKENMKESLVKYYLYEARNKLRRILENEKF